MAERQLPPGADANQQILLQPQVLPFSSGSIVGRRLGSVTCMLIVCEFQNLSRRHREPMVLDKDKIVTQEETGEEAPIDQVEDRVEAEMKRLTGEAKKQVADGIQDDELAREGERLIEEAERELNREKDS